MITALSSKHGIGHCKEEDDPGTGKLGKGSGERERSVDWQLEVDVEMAV